MGRRTAIIALALLLAPGCVRTVYVEVEKPNECYIALSEVNTVWLQPVTPISERAGDGVGDLLQDFSDVAAYGAACKIKHESLVEFLTPLIDKAKSQ